MKTMSACFPMTECFTLARCTMMTGFGDSGNKIKLCDAILREYSNYSTAVDRNSSIELYL